MPHGRGALFSAADESGTEEGEVAQPAAGEAVRSGEVSRTRWSDRDHIDVLQEMDFLQAILLGRSEVARCLVGVRAELFEFLCEVDRLGVGSERRPKSYDVSLEEGAKVQLLRQSH